MQELIKINNESKVDARELHAFLEIGKDFSTWISEKINTYGFIAGSDYSPISGNNTGLRGQPKKEYLLSLNCAKELCMLANNAKGKQARQYFIRCEEALKQIGKPQLPTTYIEALEAHLQSEKERLLLAGKLEKARPKLAAFDSLINKDGLIPAKVLADNLALKGVNAHKIFVYLTARGFFYKENNKFLPYKKYIEQGFFSVKLYENKETGKLYSHPYFMPKGAALVAGSKERINEFFNKKEAA